jgi:hypothetical protein
LFVADAALYGASEPGFLGKPAVAVPGAKDAFGGQAGSLAETPREAFVQSEAHEGYRIAQRRSDYGGVGQRWLVVHSEELEKAARQRLERRLQRRERELERELEREYWRLGLAQRPLRARRMRLRLRKRSPPRIWASITVWDLLHGLWR